MDNAIAAFVEIRNILNAPSRESVYWSKMASSDKTFLLRTAGIDPSWENKSWEELTPKSRGEIKLACTRVSSWVNTLGIIPPK